MNQRVMDYLDRRMNPRGGRDRRDQRDYRDNRDMEGRDYDYDYDMDGRRGVRGTGRGGRNYNGRGRDRADRDERRFSYEDSRDYDSRDYADYGQEPLRLTKSDMHQWKQMLRNADGSRGEHFDMQQIMQAAEKMNLRFNEYSEKEFCIVVNMMYSDYCAVVRKYIPPEKELHFYVELAKAWLDDADGPEPSEKLALYYHCIVSDEEV